MGALLCAALFGGVSAAAGTFRLPLAGPSGGGGTSADGHYTLHGAAGQPLAGTVTNESFRLGTGVVAEGLIRVRRVVPTVARDR